MDYREVMGKLEDLSSSETKEKMEGFGIKAEDSLGIKIGDLREIAKDVGKDHSLAQELWETGIREARILASMVDDPDEVTGEQMEDWVEDFESWDLCDQVCNNLFRKTKYAEDKAVEWSKRGEEFVKRAGFVLMASMVTHRKEERGGIFLKFLERCKEEAGDERKYAKKAISWAVRNIGKRNGELREEATELAEDLKESDEKSARWVGKDISRKISR